MTRSTESDEAEGGGDYRQWWTTFGCSNKITDYRAWHKARELQRAVAMRNRGDWGGQSAQNIGRRWIRRFCRDWAVSWRCHWSGLILVGDLRRPTEGAGSLSDISADERPITESAKWIWSRMRVTMQTFFHNENSSLTALAEHKNKTDLCKSNKIMIYHRAMFWREAVRDESSPAGGTAFYWFWCVSPRMQTNPIEMDGFRQGAVNPSFYPNRACKAHRTLESWSWGAKRREAIVTRAMKWLIQRIKRKIEFQCEASFWFSSQNSTCKRLLLSLFDLWNKIL